MRSFSDSYKDAGVDITAGYKAVELIKEHVQSTYTDGVVSDIGGFGGLFEPNLTGMTRPVLVSSTDGVGTKLKIAFLMDKHDTVGIDCVAMSVNDLICCGAQPLVFLDYIAVGKNNPKTIAAIVSGVAEGCRQAGCALIGGETAEMPGFYPNDEYDLAGFCTGIVDYNKIINHKELRQGDVLIALASSGIHSNGYSLVRKVFNIKEDNIGLYIDELGRTLGEELLTPTKIYVKSMQSLMSRVKVKAVSNITGGGFYENIPRMLGEDCRAVIDKASVKVLPIFNVLQKTGNIPERDMYNTFNMGVGMVIAVSEADADAAIKQLVQMGEDAYAVGHVEYGAPGVDII